MIDLEAVRTQFPALDTDWALLDNAGGSAPCRQVIERVVAHMSRRPVQLGASYPLSVEASEAVEAGRQSMALLGKVPAEDVVIGPSTTVLVQRLAKGLSRQLHPGDEIIVTNIDHEANQGPWRELADLGAKVREWRFNRDTLALEAEDLAPLLSERTRLVAFSHVSNLFGTIHDLPGICRLIREAGALSFVDGVAYAPHRRPAARQLGADFYVFSTYKTFGPHQAVLLAKRDLLGRFAPPYHGFIEDRAMGFEPAGTTYELAAALPGLTGYLKSLGEGQDETDRIDSAFARIAEHEAALAAPLLEFLHDRAGVRLLGRADSDPRHRVPTVSFVVDGRKSSEFPPLLDEKRLAVRWGHFYSTRPLAELGLLEQDGVIRVSCVHYNTPGELQRLRSELEPLL